MFKGTLKSDPEKKKCYEFQINQKKGRNFGDLGVILIHGLIVGVNSEK